MSMEKCLACGALSYREVLWNNLPLNECDECGLAWRTNLDVGLAHYEHHDTNLSDESLARRCRNVEDRLRLLEKFFAPHNLCDIGAGEGSFLKVLAENTYRNCIGVEPNEKAVAYGTQNGVTIFPGDISNVSTIISDYKIQSVTLFHVIEHLKNPREAVESLFNALPSNGYLVIETPNSRSYSFIKTAYEHPLIYPDHLYYFNQENLRRLLESVGFCTVASGKRGFDQYHMHIAQALFCLGLRKPPFLKTASNSDEKTEVTRVIKKEQKQSLIKEVIRGILSRLVVLLGRVDYQWIIARKP